MKRFIITEEQIQIVGASLLEIKAKKSYKAIKVLMEGLELIPEKEEVKEEIKAIEK